MGRHRHPIPVVRFSRHLEPRRAPFNFGRRIFESSGRRSFGLPNGLHRLAFNSLDQLIYANIVSRPGILGNAPLYCSAYHMSGLKLEKEMITGRLNIIESQMATCAAAAVTGSGGGGFVDDNLRKIINVGKNKIAVLKAMKNDVQKEINFTENYNKLRYNNSTLKKISSSITGAYDSAKRFINKNVTVRRRRFHL